MLLVWMARMTIALQHIYQFTAQTTFYTTVSSDNEYTEHLGGNATFSGLVVGVLAVTSGIVLVPLVTRDGGEGAPTRLLLSRPALFYLC